MPKMKQMILWGIIGLLMLSLIPVNLPVAQAQVDTAPIVLSIEGDFWRYQPATGSMEQFTTWGWNGIPVVSPDNTRIAYSSVATVAVEYLNELGIGGFGDGPMPTNIWVLDIASGDGFRAADQLPGASMTDGSTLIMRSAPTWSPDGAKLAWTELRAPGLSYSLVIYNMQAGTSQSMALATSDPFGIPVPLPVEWGRGGIAVQDFVLNQATNTITNRYHIFDYNGTSLGALLANLGNATWIDFTWMQDGADDYVAVLDTNGTWHLLNPKTGFEITYTGTVELFNPQFPNRHVVEAFHQFGQNSVNTLSAYGYAPSVTKTLLPNSSGLLDSYNVSPNGNSLAYSVYPNLGSYIWSSGNLQTINTSGKDISRLVWGYGQWRLGEGTALGTPVSQVIQTPVACDPELPSRLVAGQLGHVASGGANNMRDSASVNGNVVAQIPVGDNFNVLDGPTCADGLAWWQVSYNGTTGWTAEGAGIDYWLVPGSSTTVAPSLNGAVLEVTQAGSPIVARQGVSRAEAEVETLFWGDRVLWSGNKINNQTLEWFEVYLGNGQLAYVEDTGAFTVENPGYQTPGISIGSTVSITAAGDGMHLRNSTSTYSGEVATLNQGQTMTVIAGPFYSEYYIWWQYQLSGGATGYAVDVAGWLSPQ